MADQRAVQAVDIHPVIAEGVGAARSDHGLDGRRRGYPQRADDLVRGQGKQVPEEEEGGYTSTSIFAQSGRPKSSRSSRCAMT